MREKIELTFNQSEIMSEFYSRPSRKILLGKARRNEIWNAIRNGRDSVPGLEGFRQSCPALYHQIVQHIEIGGNIQSAVFSECVYAQALADISGSRSFGTASSTPRSCPRKWCASFRHMRCIRAMRT